MHIVVCIKQVPNTTQVKINPETNTLIREGVESIINPFDENALEAALVLKDTLGAKVTVVTMGPPQAEAILRESISRGADAVLLLSDRAFAGSDTWATSYALAQGIKTLGPVDLVLFGKQAIDGDTAQVGPGVGEHLGCPVITFVRKIEVDGNLLRVESVFEDGFDRIEVALPAVLTVVKEINIPRMASLKGRMASRKAVVAPVTAAAIQARPECLGLRGSPTRVIKIFTPPKKTGGLKLDGADAAAAAKTVVGKLRELKIV